MIKIQIRPFTAILLLLPLVLTAQVKKKADEQQTEKTESKQFEYIVQKEPELLKGGNPLSLSIQSSRISDLIKLFQEKTGLNIIASDKIHGSFTAYVNDVPARDALRGILEVNNLYFIENKEASLIRIVTRNEYEDYAVTNLIREKVFTVSVGKARTVANAISSMLTKGISRMLIDERNNRIVIMDVPERLEKISNVIEAFTSPPGQIYVKCHIYEFSLTEDLEFGVDWSVIDVPKVIQQVKTTFIPRDANNTAKPASSGLTIFRSDPLPQGGDIEALVHMVAGDLKVESIASPKIITQQNQKAEIHVGRQIPYNETVTQGLTGTQSSSFKFLDTGTKLIITPNITGEGAIQLQLEVEISSSPGFVEFGANGASGKAPEKISTRAQTSVLSVDKGIIIIGGLIKTENQYEDKGIPLLKDIPILKYFFSYRKLTEKKVETVIFLQPVVMMKDKYEKIPAKYLEKIDQAEK